MISSESAKLHFRNFHSFNAGGIQLTGHNLSYRHQLPSFSPGFSNDGSSCGSVVRRCRMSCLQWW